MLFDRRQALIESLHTLGVAQLLPSHSAVSHNQTSEETGKRRSLRPADFGAVGDGLSDDWEPLQKLLNIAASTGGSAYLPAGVYRITRPLILKYANSASWVSGFRVFGDGPGLFGSQNTSGTCLLPDYAHQTPAISILGSPNSDDSHKGQVNGLSIESIGIDGRFAKKCDGIHLRNVVNLTVSNVHIAHCANGIVIQREANGESFGYAHGLLFEQLTITACREWGMKSIGRGSVSATFINPNFTENSYGGISIVGCPVVIVGGGFFGNRGAAVVHRQSDSRSDSFGPVILGTRFESNGPPAHQNPSAAQIIYEHFKNSSITSSWFLGSTTGQNGIRLPNTSNRDRSAQILEVRSCRFDGMKSSINQSALSTTRQFIPHGIETCTYNNIAVPIRFYDEDSLSSLTENRMERLANSIRIGSNFYEEVEGKLLKVNL